MTKLGYIACNWRRRWAEVRGLAITYYSARPRPDLALRAKGSFRLGYSPRSDGSGAGLTEAVAVPAGWFVSLQKKAFDLLLPFFHDLLDSIAPFLSLTCSRVDANAVARGTLASAVTGPHTACLRNAIADGRPRSFYFSFDTERWAKLCYTHYCLFLFCPLLFATKVSNLGLITEGI
jgi:hypothetical protein